MDRVAVSFLVGSGSGLLFFLLTIPLFGIPPTFAPFALRTVVSVVPASIVGYLVADRGHLRGAFSRR